MFVKFVVWTFVRHVFSFLLLSLPFLRPSSAIHLSAISFQPVLAFVSPFLLFFFFFDSFSSSSAKHLLLVKTWYPETRFVVAFGFGVPGTYYTRYFDM